MPKISSPGTSGTGDFKNRNDPSIEAIPVKSAALTFGTLIFAPYVFAGMAAYLLTAQHLQCPQQRAAAQLIGGRRDGPIAEQKQAVRLRVPVADTESAGRFRLDLRLVLQGGNSASTDQG